MVSTGEAPSCESVGARLLLLLRNQCSVSAQVRRWGPLSNRFQVSTATRNRSDSRSRSPLPGRRRSHSGERGGSRRSRSRSYERSSRQRGSYSRSRSRSRRHSRSPVPGVLDDDDVTDTFIRAVAAEVKGHGSKYAQMLQEKEKNNSKYRFMLQKNVSSRTRCYFWSLTTSLQHRRHAFYRGLLEAETFKDAEFDDDVSTFKQCKVACC
jgi:U2-associated protein SR140